MRFWIGVTAAFSAGTLIGTGLGILLVEDKLKKEYKDSTASMRRAFEAARIDAETPVDTEDELIHIRPHTPESVALEGGEIHYEDAEFAPNSEGSVIINKGSTNPYHTAVDASTLNEGLFASYAELEEEDYFDEEDGHVKEQITMIYDNGVPHFFQDSEEIDDWMDRLGGTIVDDMRKAVGDGNPVVYIRNNSTGVDYEVIFEQP